MKVILRRVTCGACGARVLAFNGIAACLQCDHALVDDGQPIHLSKKQIVLLQFLLFSAHRPVPEEEVFAELWPDPDDEPEWSWRCVTVFSFQLNKKLPMFQIRRDWQKRFCAMRAA